MCEVFRAVFFMECAVTYSWVIHSNQWVATSIEKKERNRIECIRKYQNMWPTVRRGNVTLNLFQLEGDIVYSDTQLPWNWNKFNEIKHDVWVMVNPGMDLLGWQLCVSLALQELAQFLFQVYQFTLLWVFKSKSSRENGPQGQMEAREWVRKKVKLTFSTFPTPLACLLTLSKHCGFSWPCKFAFNL